MRFHGEQRCPSVFDNPETAKYVLQVFLRLNDQMEESIRAVEKRTSPGKYKAFKRGVGHVMYEVFDKIIEPISDGSRSWLVSRVI